MREACLYNNWSFCSNIFENLQGINKMNPLEFLWGGGGDESPRWGHSHRMRSEGSGDEGYLPNSFECEFISFIKTHFYGGALTSHFMEDHSSPTSIFPVLMMTSSNGNTFRVTGFWAGIHRWLLGIHRSPVNSPHTDQWRGALIFSLICAWTNGWVNNHDAGDFRRHRAHYDVTVMWCRIVIQWPGSRGIFRRSRCHSCPILNWWKGSNWGVPCIMEGMASNLAHCSTLITIPWN